MTSVTLGEIAVRFACTLRGDPDARVSHIASLETADVHAVTFVTSAKYRRHLAATQAGVVVLDAASAEHCARPVLICANPHVTFARVAALLHPPHAVHAGVHISAVVDPSAQIASDVHIGANVTIEADVVIGGGTHIGAGCVIQRGTRVGKATRLVANVTLCHDVSIGDRCLLHPGVVIGADGFGLASDRDGWVKVPQVGSVQIGNDVEIGANTTVDRGAIGDTVIGDGVKLDNQIQIGHNVRIGAHTAMAACSGVSGSTTIGSRCMIAGMVGIAGHLTICDNVVVTGRTFVNSSIRKPGVYSGGITADDATSFRKNAARFHQLDKLARTVRQIATRVGIKGATDDRDAARDGNNEEQERQ